MSFCIRKTRQPPWWVRWRKIENPQLGELYFVRYSFTWTDDMKKNFTIYDHLLEKKTVIWESCEKLFFNVPISIYVNYNNEIIVQYGYTKNIYKK